MLLLCEIDFWRASEKIGKKLRRTVNIKLHEVNEGGAKKEENQHINFKLGRFVRVLTIIAH